MVSASRGVPVVQSRTFRGTFNTIGYRKTTHIAYPVALAEARDRVIAAAKVVRHERNHNAAMREITEAVDALEALEREEPSVAALESPHDRATGEPEVDDHYEVHYARLRSQLADARRERDGFQDQRDVALRRARRAEAALAKYGRHLFACPASGTGVRACRCGLTDVLEGAGKAREPGDFDALAEARERVIAAAREYREWDGNRETPNREGVYLDTRRLIETRAELDTALAAVAVLEAT